MFHCFHQGRFGIIFPQLAKLITCVYPNTWKQFEARNKKENLMGVKFGKHCLLQFVGKYGKKEPKSKEKGFKLFKALDFFLDFLISFFEFM